MSYLQPGVLDAYAHDRVRDFLREAENDRLADQLIQPGQPLRIRLAERLRSVAEWVEGSPRLANA